MTRPRWRIRPQPAAPGVCLGCLAAVSIGMACAAGPLPPSELVPRTDHLIVIVMENHGYDQVRTEPYTASLISSASAFSSSYALVHPSQPNYLAIWSGYAQGVVSDACPPPGSPYMTENLGHACEVAEISWKAYSEDLPSPGYPGCTASDGLYVRKHCPWANFDNLNHLQECPFESLAVDIARGSLPALAFVIPNQCHNTHDCPVATGDAWLAAKVPLLLRAVGPSGLVVLTWDEDDDQSGNHILTVFAGDLVKSGYTCTRTVTHYTVLRTICDALGVPPVGAAFYETPITDVWAAPAAIPDVPRVEPWTGTAHPNPSTGEFEILLSISHQADLDASVYDAAGGLVARLLPGSSAPVTRLVWNGRRDDGRAVPGGAYFLRVKNGHQLQGQKLILLQGPSGP